MAEKFRSINIKEYETGDNRKSDFEFGFCGAE